MVRTSHNIFFLLTDIKVNVMLRADYTLGLYWRIKITQKEKGKKKRLFHLGSGQFDMVYIINTFYLFF